VARIWLKNGTLMAMFWGLSIVTENVRYENNLQLPPTLQPQFQPQFGCDRPPVPVTLARRTTGA
jgi:hypothetical protein